MAGTWIKMMKNLHDNPKVEEIAVLTGLDTYAVVGRLHKLWSWVDEVSEDGRDLLTTDDRINCRIQCDTFATALRQVGWIEGEGKSISFVNFTEHNGATAKKRAADSARIGQKRRCRQNVANDATKTRPEKRREEKSKTSPSEKKGDASASRAAEFDWDRDCPPNLNTTAVRDAMDDWFEYRRERKLAKWKPSTIKKQLAAFVDDGPTAFVAAVDHSIRQQYQGLFAPSGGGARGSPGTRLNDQHTIKSDDDPLDRLMRNAREAG